MAKRTNWWLEGWQYEESLGPGGRRQRKLVYKGEYYTFGMEKRRLKAYKAVMLSLTLVLTFAYVLAFALTKNSAPRIFAGACMLIVIPLMYLLIGTGCLVSAKDPLTYRDYRGSVLRIRWTSIAVAGLSALGSIGELGYLLTGGGRTDTELWWLAGMIVTCLSAAAIALLEHRYHPRLIPPELR